LGYWLTKGELGSFPPAAQDCRRGATRGGLGGVSALGEELRGRGEGCSTRRLCRGTGPSLRGDVTRIGQAFNNLLRTPLHGANPLMVTSK
jgi:hypothetical protein